MKIYLPLLIYFFFYQISFAQISFERSFGNLTDVERGFCSQQTYDGGYIVTGTNSFDETGSENIVLIKTDSSGNQIWSKGQFDFGLYQCSPNSIKITPDSGFIITGGSWNVGGDIGVKDVFLIKTDKDGNQQWVQTYDSIQSDPAAGIFYNERGLDVILAHDQGFLITGVAGHEAFLLKTDSIGNKLWLAKDTGEYRAVGNSLTEAENNTCLVIGYTTANLSTTFKMYLTKFDANGSKLWGQTYSWSQGNYSLGFSVKVNSSEEYVLLGLGRYNGSQYGEMLLIKTDTAGIPIWENSFLKNNFTTGYALDVTGDNGYILSGESFDSIIGYRAYLVKTDSLGNKTWDETYSGDVGYSVQQTSDSGYIISGVKTGDIYLLKTNSNGTVTSSAGIKSAEISLLIYPNPSIGSVNILLMNKTDLYYNINIYDAIGRKINSIENIKSNQEIVIDSKIFNKGVNVIELYTDSGILYTRKIIIY